MPDDDLYIGPTVLAPGSTDDVGAGDRVARKILVPLVVLLLAVVLVFYVFFNQGRVVGPSMLPTLHGGDMMLLTKGYASPQRGDIVVATVTEQGQPVELVKRVIALPGDTIEIRDDVAIVNGQPEPARGQVIDSGRTDTIAPYQVPAGSIYLMGDNRPDSEDSRYLGPVPVSQVKGRAVALYGPVNRIRLVR